jgi:ParB/RepB/Spo0J family partition protein
VGDSVQIELSRLREPSLPMRETMNDAGLEELASSIRALGVLQALGVRALGDGTFEVVFGHRRQLAARLAGLVSVPCVIHENEETAVAARVHENLIREDVAPAEEAVYYAQLYGQLGDDVDRVAATVRRSREYVERRLLLLRGNADVLAALRAGRVNLGQAEELNRFQLETDARYYLEYTERAGGSIRQLREWRAQANARAQLAAQAAPPAPAFGTTGEASGAAAAPAGPLYASMAKPWEFSSSVEERDCMFCGERREEWKMFRKFVCQPCANEHLVRHELERGKDGA